MKRPSGKLRIIGGEFRSRIVDFDPAAGVRPTPDRVRQTLFDWLTPVIAGARCLDLFAGSGALGLEALSRGAAYATFVERDAAVAAALKRNAEKLDATGRAQILAGSALALPRTEPFDLIFADPPYGAGSGTAVVSAVLKAGWLAPGGWMSVETSRDEEVDCGELELDASRVIGRARLTLLRRP